MNRLVIALFFLVVAAGCSNPDNGSIEPKASDFPDQEGWNSTVTVTADGKLSAIIRYAHMQKFSSRKVVNFNNGIAVDFYNNQGEHASKLTADKGEMYETTGDVEAIENVVVISDSGMTLRTSQLRWVNQLEKITSDAFVTITTAEGDTLYGKGFVSDQNLKNWQINQPTGVTQKSLSIKDIGAKKPNARSVDTPDSLALPALPRQMSAPSADSLHNGAFDQKQKE